MNQVSTLFIPLVVSLVFLNLPVAGGQHEDQSAKVIPRGANGARQTVAGGQHEDQSAKGLTCSVVGVKEQLLPFESIEVVFTVKNDTDQVKRIVGPWDCWLHYPVKRDWFRDPEGLEADGIKWGNYHPLQAVIDRPSSHLSVTFAPREAKKLSGWVQLLQYEDGTGEHILARPGRYLFKGSIHRFICNKIEIVVKRPTGADNAAYEYLKQHPLHRFFHEWTIPKFSYDQATVEQMERFIVRFKRSQYAEMAKLGLALMWREGVEGKKDLERAQRLLQEVAKSADEARAARAYYYLGQLEEEQGQLIEAQQYYTGALSLKVDAYIRWRAEEAREAIEQQLSAPKR